MHPLIPVTVITGFLGAGKSTLLESWLNELSREETAVIINEVGEVGIDGALLAQRALRIREITGGCICCTTWLALDRALADMAAAQPRPTRILVETSGAASPAGVIRALTRGTAQDELRLDGVITVLDAHRAQEVMAFDLTIEQLGFADIVALSHADQCTPAQLAQLEQSMATHAPGAVVAQTHNGQLAHADAKNLLELLATRGGVLRMPDSAHSIATHHGITTVSLTHDGELDEDRFTTWVEESLGTIEARILRVKGILAIRGIDERVIVQGVSEAVEVSCGTAWADARRTSRIVIVGIAIEAKELRETFAACVLREGESSG